MGWLGNLMEKIKGAEPVSLTFVPSVRAPHIPAIDLELTPDECYVELYLESLRLTRARRFATRFHAVAYSFVGLARAGDESASLAAVSKPARLTELDNDALDSVITVSKQMMGATPYRGGAISLEFGLFSIKAGNVLTSMIDYVARVSSVAGISYVGAIKPFLPLITEGMDMLAGQTDDVSLEVGVDTALNQGKSMVCAIIAAPAGTIDGSRLVLGSDGTLVLDDAPLKYGYAVFSLRRANEKADFGEVPELRAAYADFSSAVRKGDYAAAQDAFAVFKRLAIVSPDLISSHARKLVAVVEAKLDEAFAEDVAGVIDLPPELLAEVALY